MYSYIVSVPRSSATSAQTVLTELVSAVVRGISPKLSPPAFSSGTPEITLPDSPLTVSSTSNSPLSSAAVAVTTFIVEPGGYPAWVARLNSGASGSWFRAWKPCELATSLGS